MRCPHEISSPAPISISAAKRMKNRFLVFKKVKKKKPDARMKKMKVIHSKKLSSRPRVDTVTTLKKIYTE
jgi:hypothetical protein